jgi:hypothetical protein
MIGDYELLQQKHDGRVRGISIVSINSDTDPEFTRAHNVRGFPTLRYYPKGFEEPSIFYDYVGERDYHSMLSALRRMD